MRHEQTIRFSQPLRAVRLADLNQSHAATGATAIANAAAAQETERQERESERKAVEHAVTALTEAAQTLANRQRELLGEMQQAAIELAMAVATRVTYDKLETDRFAIEELVRSAVSRLDGAAPIQVRLHPEDVALVKRRLNDKPITANKDIQWISDAAMKRGDCVAETGDVGIVSRLEEQLTGIRQHLLRNLSNAQAERRKPMPGDRELRRFPDRRETA